MQRTSFRHWKVPSLAAIMQGPAQATDDHEELAHSDVEAAAVGAPSVQRPQPVVLSVEAPTSAQQVFDLVKVNSRERRSTIHGRVVGESRASRPHFMRFIQRILDSDTTLGECGSRVLRLKPTLDLDTTTFEVDMVIEALRHNYRIEALYIHNFEHVRHCILDLWLMLGCVLQGINCHAQQIPSTLKTRMLCGVGPAVSMMCTFCVNFASCCSGLQ
jgi:hypothetical protein